MILANFAQQNRNTLRELGLAFSNPFAQFKPALFPSFYCGDHSVSGVTNQSSFPHGYNGQSAWHMAPKAGGMASVNNATGSGSVTANALAVKLAQAGLTGAGGLTALGSLIVSAIASLTGSGTITAANLQAFLSAVAALTGSGTISAAGATGRGQLIAALEASGTAAGSTLTGTGELGADIFAYGELTPEGIRDAIWSALAANYNTAGTMGSKLNSASSGGVDYGALADAVRTELGVELAAVLEVWRRHGLDIAAPLTQTAASITAGDIALTITGDPDTSITVTREP